MFEQEAMSFGVIFGAYRTDNRIFTKEQFINELHHNWQKITVSGVGAHHQNGVAERGIQTTITKSWTQLLDKSLHNIMQSLITGSKLFTVMRWEMHPRMGCDHHQITVWSKLRPGRHQELRPWWQMAHKGKAKWETITSGKSTELNWTSWPGTYRQRYR